MTQNEDLILRQQTNQLFLTLWFANLTLVLVMTGLTIYLGMQDGDPFAANGVWERLLAEPVSSGVFALGFLSLGLSLVLPKKFSWRTKGLSLGESGPLDPMVKAKFMLPYVVRVCLAEFCGVAGFLVAIFLKSTVAGLPLMIASLVVLFISRPSDDLLRSFRSN